MKKVVSLLLCACLCLGCMLSLSSCSLKHPIDALREKLDSSRNFQMKVTMKDVPLLGDVKSIVKMDGNKQHYSAVMLEPEYYTEEVDGVTYKYFKNLKGEWTKIQMKEDDDKLVDDSTLKDVLKKENFEKVKDQKNTYRQKSGVEFEHFSDVVISYDRHSCTVEMNLTANGLSLACKLEFTNFGEIKIDLPKVEE